MVMVSVVVSATVVSLKSPSEGSVWSTLSSTSPGATTVGVSSAGEVAVSSETVVSSEVSGTVVVTDGASVAVAVVDSAGWEVSAGFVSAAVVLWVVATVVVTVVSV